MDRKPQKHCIFCDTMLLNYSSLNDGGTIICGSCKGWFHPERTRGSLVIAAHKYNGSGPLSCEICHPTITKTNNNNRDDD